MSNDFRGASERGVSAPNFAFMDENVPTERFSDNFPATQNLGGNPPAPARTLLVGRARC